MATKSKFENVAPEGELIYEGRKVPFGEFIEVAEEVAERLREQSRNWREVIAEKKQAVKAAEVEKSE